MHWELCVTDSSITASESLRVEFEWSVPTYEVTALSNTGLLVMPNIQNKLKRWAFYREEFGSHYLMGSESCIKHSYIYDLLLVEVYLSVCLSCGRSQSNASFSSRCQISRSGQAFRRLRTLVVLHCVSFHALAAGRLIYSCIMDGESAVMWLSSQCVFSWRSGPQ
jgi:hypothetical protein